MQAFFQLRRDQPDHAGMPARFVQRHAHRVDMRHAGDHLFGFGHHRGLQVAPFQVDRVELFGMALRLRRVVAEQAFDAQPHVLQPTRRVHPRRQRKTQVAGG